MTDFIKCQTNLLNSYHYTKNVNHTYKVLIAHLMLSHVSIVVVTKYTNDSLYFVHILSISET